MSASPRQRRRSSENARLVPFAPAAADAIASWAGTPEETYWLAPRTPPPLSAAVVLDWQRQRRGYLLTAGQPDRPLAYGELNPTNMQAGEYWLGHIITDPAQRGRGYGRLLVELLVRRAFTLLGARRVTLVVFPQNSAAIACYRAVGFGDDGWETHDFAAYGRRDTLLRMAMSRLL